MFVKLGALPGVHKKTGEKFSDIFAWNHHGTETIPPRPVLRIAAERIAGEFVKKRMKAFTANMIHNPRDAKRLETVLLQDMGRQAIAEAKRIIDANDGALQRNAPATVAKKGFDKPLFETGELQKHLSYEVSEEQ